MKCKQTKRLQFRKKKRQEINDLFRHLSCYFQCVLDKSRWFSNSYNCLHASLILMIHRNATKETYSHFSVHRCRRGDFVVRIEYSLSHRDISWHLRRSFVIFLPWGVCFRGLIAAARNDVAVWMNRIHVCGEHHGRNTRLRITYFTACSTCVLRSRESHWQFWQRTNETWGKHMLF